MLTMLLPILLLLLLLPPSLLYNPCSTTSAGPGCLVAQNQLYWICLYSDANMVLFSNGKAIW
jgi:hypothetical protein